MKTSSLLRAFLKQSKLSQTELAKQLGVSKASVTLWLSGHVPGPLNALALDRLSGGAVPAASWSAKYAKGLLTFGADREAPSSVLNERSAAVSQRNSTRRPAAGGK